MEEYFIGNQGPQWTVAFDEEEEEEEDDDDDREEEEEEGGGGLFVRIYILLASS
jgi:hypothetical protein